MSRPTERDARALPLDLLLVLGVVAGAVALVAAPDAPLPGVRPAVAALLVFLAPGYAVVAALFPDRGDAWSADGTHGLDGAERLVLSAGLSVAVVGLLGLGLGLFGFPVTPPWVVGTVSAVTAVAVGIAAVRRPPDAGRTTCPGLSAVASLRSASLRTNVLAVVVVVSLVVATAGIGFAMTQRGPGESFTELSVLTRDASGDLVAGGYPTDLAVGNHEPLVVAVGNREHERARYTVLVTLQSVHREADGTVVVDDQETLSRRTLTVAPSRTEQVPVDVAPTMTGRRLRLLVLLYRGDPPASPSLASADGDVHLWVNVTG